MTDTEFTSVAPVLPVRDLDAALDRYRRLGFDTHACPGPDRCGYADRGGVSLHLSEWQEHDPLRTGSGGTAVRVGSPLAAAAGS